MKKLKAVGFTLIELLVVIAIIGLLSSIVLASLSTTRNKAKDASVIESMSSMRAEAEIYNQNGTYPSTLCDNNGELGKLLGAINSQITDDIGDATCALSSSRTAWVVFAILNTGDRLNCVDSTGVSKIYTYPETNDFNWLNYICEN